jgi:hypothetical protein
MSQLFSIILSLFGWWFGKKVDQAKRAKEIMEKFDTLTKDGDKFSENLREGLNKKSDVEWKDIELREE